MYLPDHITQKGKEKNILSGLETRSVVEWKEGGGGGGGERERERDGMNHRYFSIVMEKGVA